MGLGKCNLSLEPENRQLTIDFKHLMFCFCSVAEMSSIIV